MSHIVKPVCKMYHVSICVWLRVMPADVDVLSCPFPWTWTTAVWWSKCSNFFFLRGDVIVSLNLPRKSISPLPVTYPFSVNSSVEGVCVVKYRQFVSLFVQRLVNHCNHSLNSKGRVLLLASFCNSAMQFNTKQILTIFTILGNHQYPFYQCYSL